MRDWEHYYSKSDRDARAADLKSRGAVNVKKRSSRNQCISPSYIIGYPFKTYPNGFGGAADTFVAVLYTVEWE